MYRLTQSPQTFVPIPENPLGEAAPLATPLAHRYGVTQKLLTKVAHEGNPQYLTFALFCTCCLDILPVQASYKSCSWGKPPRPHFCAFLYRTSYIQFSRCIVPTTWFSFFSTRLFSHTFKPLLSKVEEGISAGFLRN